MKWRDIKIGATAYHITYTHWGPLKIAKKTSADFLENLFEKGRQRVIVEFEDGTVGRVHPRELRKTPNKKKIKEMVTLYRKRGVEAVDGGDRLILPKRIEK